MKYNALRIIKEGLTGNKNWKPAWREPEPKSEYDVIIIGGGGHGLSTAYYLAKNHGITNVAVLEKGYIGSGNIGRNTTIVRANYMIPGNSEFYSHSLKLWENMETDLNYNAMVSQRGIINLFHSDGQRDAAARRATAACAGAPLVAVPTEAPAGRVALSAAAAGQHHGAWRAAVQGSAPDARGHRGEDAARAPVSVVSW